MRNRKTYINLARELNEKIDKIYNKKVPNIVNNDTIQWKNSRINDYNLKKFELIGLSTSKNLPFIIIRTSLDMYVYIIYSPETETIILTFRGTNSNVSIKSDLNYKKQYMEDNKFFFHKGIYNQLEGLVCRIIYSMKKLITDNLKNTNIKVLVCGHSLGGALATMFSYYYCKEFDRSLKTDNLLEKKIYVISWGAPKIGGAVLRIRK